MNWNASQSGPSAQAKNDLETITGTCQVFVGGLDSRVLERDLMIYFAQFGDVSATSVERSANRKSKGYGYVSFTSSEAAFQASNWKTHQLLGQPVSVELARDYNSRVNFHKER